MSGAWGSATCCPPPPLFVLAEDALLGQLFGQCENMGMAVRVSCLLGMGCIPCSRFRGRTTPPCTAGKPFPAHHTSGGLRSKPALQGSSRREASEGRRRRTEIPLYIPLGQGVSWQLDAPGSEFVPGVLYYSHSLDTHLSTSFAEPSCAFGVCILRGVGAPSPAVKLAGGTAGRKNAFARV